MLFYPAALPLSRRALNPAARTKLRTPDKPAITQLKNWDTLHRLRCCPQRSDQITRAVLALQLREAGRKRLSVRPFRTTEGE